MNTFINSFFTVGEQVIILFLLIMVGVICKKRGILNESGVKGLTSILLLFVTPSLLITSFQRECTPEQLRMVGASALVGITFHLISIILAHTLVRDKDKSRDVVLKFAVVFTNAGFMSIPLQQAVLGDDGVFCGAVIVGIFNLLCWTYGLWLMSGSSNAFSLKKIFINPGVIGLSIALGLFLLKIKLPFVIEDSCQHIASLNTPGAMIVIGYHLASSPLCGIIKDRGAILSLLLRLIVSPLALILLLSFFSPIDRTLLIATTIAASAPSAALTTMFSVKFNRDTALSVKLVSLSTIISILTMPLMVALADTIIKTK